MVRIYKYSHKKLMVNEFFKAWEKLWNTRRSLLHQTFFSYKINNVDKKKINKSVSKIKTLLVLSVVRSKCLNLCTTFYTYYIKIGDMALLSIRQSFTKLLFKLLQVPLRPSIMNQSPDQNGSCKRSQKYK